VLVQEHIEKQAAVAAAERMRQAAEQERQVKLLEAAVAKRKAEIITVGSHSGSCPKVVKLPSSSAGMVVSNTPANPQGPGWTDSFRVEVEGDLLKVFRVDAPNCGWGQSLELKTCADPFILNPSWWLHAGKTRHLGRVWYSSSLQWVNGGNPRRTGSGCLSFEDRFDAPNGQIFSYENDY